MPGRDLSWSEKFSRAKTAAEAYEEKYIRGSSNHRGCRQAYLELGRLFGSLYLPSTEDLDYWVNRATQPGQKVTMDDIMQDIPLGLKLECRDLAAHYLKLYLDYDKIINPPAVADDKADAERLLEQVGGPAK